MVAVGGFSYMYGSANSGCAFVFNGFFLLVHSKNTVGLHYAFGGFQIRLEFMNIIVKRKYF
jgi:hypothetical protein